MNSSRIGMNSVKNSVCGSRRMWSNSLRATDSVRRRDVASMGNLVKRTSKEARKAGKVRRKQGARGLAFYLFSLLSFPAFLASLEGFSSFGVALAGPRQGYENIFQVGLRRADDGARPRQLVQRGRVVHQGVNRLAEDGRLADA